MTQKKGISVVIPNYNGANLLPQILPPLKDALVYSGLPYEIIISDDSSTDKSVEIIQKNYTEIILLQNAQNVGFSKTINKGIFIAQYDYLLLLNSDVKLTLNYFEKLIPYFEMPDTFGVMGRIIGWNDDKIQDGGKYPYFHGLKIKTSGNYIPLEPKEDDKLYSMYLSGANALVSREKILTLSGFDEIFSPFYIEDFEMSLRAWRLGWKCYYEHTAICRHKTSTTIKNKNSEIFIKKIYNRNKMILHAIHLPRGKMWLWYIQLLGEAFIQTLLGKFWFIASVGMFFDSKKARNTSKSSFLAISKKEPLLLSVKEVVAIMHASLTNKAINIFK